MPFVESEDVVLLKTLFAKLSARTEGSETRSEGCPTALSPISVRTEIGCPRGTSAKRLYFLKKGKRIAAVALLLRNDRTTVNRTFYGGCND